MSKFKYVYGICLFFLAIFSFQACQSDPEFPDPGFEIGDKRVEVRRDTADYYDIKVKGMSVPNKVERIEILNAMDYSVIETINDYNGKTNFDFVYRVDLTDYDTDTVLNYIIKVVDQDKRSTNSGIRISVKGFSFPEIKLVSGTKIALAAPAYYVKGKISTGLNALTSVKVLFEGTEQYSFVPSPGDAPIYEMDLKALVFLGNLNPGQEYYIDIIISDDQDQTSTTRITVTKSSSIKKPRRINYTNSAGLVIAVDLQYDSEGRITYFDFKFPNGGSNYSHKFHYNNLGVIDTIRYRNVANDGTYSSDVYKYINYVSGTTKISNIESQSFDYANGATTVNAKSTVASNFVYNTDQTISSCKFTTVISNIKYTDPFNLGEKVYSEYFQSSSFWSSNTINRQYVNDYDPVLMPTYTPGFPQFIQTTSAVLDFFHDIFWSKYVPLSVIATDPAYTNTGSYRYLYQPTYSYETDDDGNISTITKYYNAITGTNAGKVLKYVFFYD